MSDRKQSADPSAPSSNPATRGAPSSSTASSPVASSTYDTSGREKNESELPHSRDQGGQEATERIEGKKHGQKEQREEIMKEEEGKRQIAARTNNKPAPAPGGVGGPMGTEEGRKEDRLKGKL